jgi:hypothetical protein
MAKMTDKRRWLSLVLLALVLAFPAPGAAAPAKDMEPGTWTGSGGHRRIRFGDHTWRVLKLAVYKGRKEALLLAEDLVDKRQFNSSDDNVDRSYGVRPALIVNLSSPIFTSLFSSSKYETLYGSR